jgi:hypothetical protein
MNFVKIKRRFAKAIITLLICPIFKIINFQEFGLFPTLLHLESSYSCQDSDLKINRTDTILFFYLGSIQILPNNGAREGVIQSVK